MRKELEGDGEGKMIASRESQSEQLIIMIAYLATERSALKLNVRNWKINVAV